MALEQLLPDEESDTEGILQPESVASKPEQVDDIGGVGATLEPVPIDEATPEPEHGISETKVTVEPESMTKAPEELGMTEAIPEPREMTGVTQEPDLARSDQVTQVAVELQLVTEKAPREVEQATDATPEAEDVIEATQEADREVAVTEATVEPELTTEAPGDNERATEASPEAEDAIESTQEPEPSTTIKSLTIDEALLEPEHGISETKVTVEPESMTEAPGELERPAEQSTPVESEEITEAFGEPLEQIVRVTSKPEQVITELTDDSEMGHVSQAGAPVEPEHITEANETTVASTREQEQVTTQVPESTPGTEQMIPETTPETDQSSVALKDPEQVIEVDEVQVTMQPEPISESTSSYGRVTGEATQEPERGTLQTDQITEASPELERIPEATQAGVTFEAQLMTEATGTETVATPEQEQTTQASPETGLATTPGLEHIPQVIQAETTTETILEPEQTTVATPEPEQTTKSTPEPENTIPEVIEAAVETIPEPERTTPASPELEKIPGPTEAGVTVQVQLVTGTTERETVATPEQEQTTVATPPEPERVPEVVEAEAEEQHIAESIAEPDLITSPEPEHMMTDLTPEPEHMPQVSEARVIVETQPVTETTEKLEQTTVATPAAELVQIAGVGPDLEQVTQVSETGATVEPEEKVMKPVVEQVSAGVSAEQHPSTTPESSNVTTAELERFVTPTSRTVLKSTLPGVVVTHATTRKPKRPERRRPSTEEPSSAELDAMNSMMALAERRKLPSAAIHRPSHIMFPCMLQCGVVDHNFFFFCQRFPENGTQSCPPGVAQEHRTRHRRAGVGQGRGRRIQRLLVQDHA